MVYFLVAVALASAVTTLTFATIILKLAGSGTSDTQLDKIERRSYVPLSSCAANLRAGERPT